MTLSHKSGCNDNSRINLRLTVSALATKGEFQNFSRLYFPTVLDFSVMVNLIAYQKKMKMVVNLIFVQETLDVEDSKTQTAFHSLKFVMV